MIFKQAVGNVGLFCCIGKAVLGSWYWERGMLVVELKNW